MREWGLIFGKKGVQNDYPKNTPFGETQTLSWLASGLRTVEVFVPIATYFRIHWTAGLVCYWLRPLFSRPFLGASPKIRTRLSSLYRAWPVDR